MSERMPEFLCPGCQAEIEPDLIERTGRAECPFCLADLSALDLPRPESITPSAEATLAGNAADALTRPLPALPPKSRIQVVESTPDRMVLYIPAGGKQTAGLGCFALFWNLFMCAFTPPWFIGLFQGKGNDGPPMLFIVPFLGLFWAVGLGMAYFWLKMKNERTFVLLERERVVLQKVFFSRKKVAATSLTPDSLAQLVESYSQNDVPVYRVEINGSDGAAKFGTALADEEKDWIVDRVNEFLGRVAPATGVGAEPVPSDPNLSAARLQYPDACDKCGAPLAGMPTSDVLTCSHCGAIHRGTPFPAATMPAQADETYEPLTPETLPAGSAIVVDDASPDVLQFHVPATPHSPVRWIVPLFAIPFSLAWYGGVITFVGGAVIAPLGPARFLFLLFAVPFLIAGLLPLTIGLFTLAGRITVRLDAESLAARWHIGRVGYSRKLPVGSIASVRVEEGQPGTRNRRVRARPLASRTHSDSRCCIVRGAGKMLPLTFFHDEATARQMASLLRTRLAELGIALNDG